MEPLRPSDHFDANAIRAESDDASAIRIVQPRLRAGGYLRFAWRQLTSMRTALVLLLLLTVAAIPGSLVPQRSADPNGVVQYRRNNPDLFPILDGLQLFDTYTSVWFSAIYLLLFVSLIGCIIPRTLHHARALRAEPPKTPARLQRLVGYQTADAPGTVDEALDAARAELRRLRYRVARYGDSLSAERGYLRETGNLVFHASLVGILATVGFAGGFGYNGQKVIVEGDAFINQLGTYDSFNPGRLFNEARLDPFAVALEEFVPEYAVDRETGMPQALDYTAYVSVTEDGTTRREQIKVNEPIAIAGTTAYLLGNGFAPTLTVRDPDGKVVFQQPTAYLPQDSNLTSLGVIKIPDGLAEQVGMISFFYPSALPLASGALTSIFPEPDQPVLTLNAFTGDLGLDAGVPRNAYALNTDGLTQITGGDTGVESLVLGLGQSADLPNGLGSVEFTSLQRFVSLEFHHDPTQEGVLIFAILLLAGLIVSLWVPRRRLWVVATGSGSGVRLQYAGLARGDDPALESAVAAFAKAHGERLAPATPPGAVAEKRV